MEPPKPWLADFIKTSLDAWFGELEGRRSADYQFQKIDDKLKASYRPPCGKTVYLLKLPKLGATEPQGEISDGIHKIEAIFTKGSADEVTGSGAQHGTPLHLADPVLRVTPHVNPPKPLLEITACKIVDESDRLGKSLSTSCAVTEDEDVRKRMFKYGGVKKHNRAPSRPASRSSHESFKSQVDFSKEAYQWAANSDGDAEGNVSQQPFCTQVPNGLSGWNLTTPPRSAGRTGKGPDTRSKEDRFLPLPKDIQEANGSADYVPSRERQQPAPEADSRPSTEESTTRHNESQLPPSTTSSQRLRPTPKPRSRSANPTPPRIQIPPASTAENPKSSPVEMSELGGNIPKSPGQLADHTHEKRPSPTTTPSPGKSVVAPPLAGESHTRFQCSRHELRAGRYIPRHIQRIPRQQAKLLSSLLDSGDCWQPPLVGRTQRPGEVPLNLLVQLSDAADKRASNPPLSTKDAEPGLSQDTHPTQRGQDQEFESAHPSEGNASDSEEFAEWSQSPPTQKRRAIRLPPSSPPPDLTRQKQPSQLVGGVQEGNAISSRPEPPFDSSISQEQGSEVHSLSHNHSPPSLGPVSHQSGGSRSSAREIPPAQLQHADVNDKSSSQEDTPSMVAGVSDGSSSKKIQITRTPYGGKGSNLPQLLASRITSTMTRKVMDGGNITSTYVPGTYFEPSSGGPPAIERSIEALPEAKDSKTIPGSDQNSHMVAKFEPHAVEANKSVDANPGKSSSAMPHAHLDDTLSSSDCLQGKMPSRPDQEDLAISDDGKCLSSQVREIETVGVRVVDVGVAVEGQEYQVTAENDPGSSKIGASGAGDKGPVQTMSETEELISVPAKRKRTNSGNNDISTKKPRQEQEISGTNAEDVELFKRVVERLEQRQRQDEADWLEDSLRSPISPPLIARDRDRECPQRQGRSHDRLETSRLMDKRNTSSRHSLPSSRADNGSNSGPVELSPKQGRRNRQLESTTLVPRRSSTPITRQSVYGEVDTGAVKVMADESHTADSLFARYRAAYPDYQGSVDDFLNSYCFIREIWNREQCPRSIHPVLIDDAVFHHFHSYQPYSRTAGTAAMVFAEFFHNLMDLRHNKGIIRPSALESGLGRGGTLRPSTVDEDSMHQRRELFVGAPVLSPETAKSLTTRETIAEQQRFKQLAQASELGIKDKERIDSIERWREEAVRPASPELGTPDVDKSVSQRTTPKIESREQATKTSIHPTPPDPRNPLETSPSLFIKPPRPTTEAGPASVEASTTRSSSVRVKKRASTRHFWRGTSTAFTAFEQQYAKLAAEKKSRASSETAGPSSSRQKTGSRAKR